MSDVVSVHRYRNGVESTWYSSESAALSALESVPMGLRCVSTLRAPLLTSPNGLRVWRVDVVHESGVNDV
jgi:hypothetical protein